MAENMYYRVNQIIEEKDYKAFCKQLAAMKMLCTVLAILSALIIAAVFITGKELLFSIVFSVVYIAIIIPLMLRYPARMAKNMYQTYCKMQNTYVMHSEIVFTDAYIYDNEVNVNSRFSYSQIKKVVEKDDYIFLLISENGGIILKKSGFNIGDVNTFINFINAKRTVM